MKYDDMVWYTYEGDVCPVKKNINVFIEFQGQLRTSETVRAGSIDWGTGVTGFCIYNPNSYVERLLKGEVVEISDDSQESTDALAYLNTKLLYGDYDFSGCVFQLNESGSLQPLYVLRLDS